MSPTSQEVIPTPQHQQQQLGAAAQALPAPSSSGKLSFEDVSKLFSLPIAEAATILGVCTSVLKRICRKNGVVRWPYRKFLAGKSVEEIKIDAAREKIKELEKSKTAKQRLDVPNIMSSTSVGLPSTFGNQVMNRTSGVAQETFKMQRGVSIPGHVLQQEENKYLQYKWPNAVQFNPAKTVPSYMDEFKYGFPAKGLSSVSTKWWGGRNSEEDTGRAIPEESTTEEEENKGSCGLSNETHMCMAVGYRTENNSEASGLKADPTALLCSVRKKAVQYGRNSLKVGVSKGCVTHKLSKRQRLLLLQVFKSSLPDEWKGMHC